MDENKRKRLHEVRFRILNNCGLCEHGEFPSDDWGTCGVHQYEHIKHTGDPRQLSIHRYGSCPSFSGNPKARAALAKFEEYNKPIPEAEDVGAAIYLGAVTCLDNEKRAQVVTDAVQDQIRSDFALSLLWK